MAESPIYSHLKAQIGKEVADMPQGFSTWLQPKILEVEDGSITIEVTVRPEMCNPIGTIHGGIHAAILDELIGMTVAAMGNDSHFVSLNMTVDFLRAIPGLEKVRATCNVIKRGRTTMHIIGQISDLSGKELSRATVNMVSSGKPLSF